MNIIMKRISNKEKYEDLSELTTQWNNHYKYGNIKSEDDWIVLLCEFNLGLLVDKEDIFLKIRKQERINKILRKTLEFFRKLIPRDEFQGRYRQ